MWLVTRHSQTARPAPTTEAGWGSGKASAPAHGHAGTLPPGPGHKHGTLGVDNTGKRSFNYRGLRAQVWQTCASDALPGASVALTVLPAKGPPIACMPALAFLAAQSLAVRGTPQAPALPGTPQPTCLQSKRKPGPPARQRRGLLDRAPRAHPAAGAGGTYELEHVPVEHVVVGEALAVEQVPEQLPQV